MDKHVFDKPLEGWKDKMGNIRNMSGMFKNAKIFNKPLNEMFDVTKWTRVLWGRYF